MAELLVARSPQDGADIGSYPISSRDDVSAAMERAREVSAGWARTPISERISYVSNLVRLLVDEADTIVAKLGLMAGKPPVEALTGDVMVTVDILHYYVQHAEEILAPQPRPSSMLNMGATFHVEWMPAGVVAVISPWNYPLQLSLVPAATALIAGNAVILKPSELVPGIGVLIDDLIRRSGFPASLLQVVQGGGPTGEALVQARPDMVFFTGSVATGRLVAQCAGRLLVPVELELGGKDAMIVFADASMKRAVGSAAYGAFANAGQACVSVERCYVQRPIYEEFLTKIAEQARSIRTGSAWDADIGPLIRPAQADLVEVHVREAVEQGARLVTEIVRSGQWIRPVVLADANHQMRVMREETFGPVLPVMPFDTEQEAIRLANDSEYGLAASVFTQDDARARRVASLLRVGSVAINDVVVKQVGNPSTPFGGMRASGWGRYHGPEGLYAFSRSKAVMVGKGLPVAEPNWFPHNRRLYQTVKALLYARFGAPDLLSRGREIGSALWKAVRG